MNSVAKAFSSVYSLLSPTKPMTTPQGMEVFEARLATFGTAQPNKKRTSNAKNAKGLKWPHASPSPDQLAQAGFFYQPSSASPDNVTCYSCRKDLDGWDEEDNAIKEHLALSPDCGYALQLGIENELGVGNEEESNPMSERMIEARKATFGDMWPHERKRGWQCKSQKMAEAGWYYCPTPESEDFVKCAYCSLSLDGWEPKDKPYDEHHRRSPECTFFTSQQNAKPKATRGKKGRTSKASRMSTQTNTTITADDHTMTDAGLDGESVLTTAQEPTAPKGKKAGRAKKGQSKAKAQKMQAEEPQFPSSFVEPEDDNFEVKVPEPPVKKSTRGKKRTSEQMEADNPPDDAAVPPPTKRRAGRTRSSTVKPESVLEPSQLDNTVVDVTMTDAEEQAPPVPKKKGKGGRKRASSTTRKTSTASTASKASLRADIPGDDEIDAALEADLNRPLTDDEDTKMAIDEQPAPVRRGRAASKSKKGKASAAQLRGAAQKHSETPAVIEDSVVQVMSTQEPESMIIDEIPPIKNPKGRSRNAKGAANVPKPVELIDGTPIEQSEVQPSTEMAVDGIISQESTTAPKPPAKAKGRQPKGRQASRKKVAQEPQAPTVAVQPEVPVEDSDLTVTSKAGDPGHDLDDSLASQSTVKRGGRKASATQKKGKASKKTTTAPKYVEELAPPPPQMEMEVDPEPETAAPKPSLEIVIDEEPKRKSTKRQSRSNGKKASISQIEEDMAVQQLEMVDEDVEMVSETPLEEVEVVSETPLEEGHDQTVLVLEEQEVEYEAEVEPEVELPSLPIYPPTPQQSRQIPSPTPSPQSSDAENHPPSSRPSQTRPPLAELSPMQPRTMLVPLATTPKQSPSKQNISKLETTFPWSRIEFEEFFAGTPRADREKVNLEWFGTELTEEEKNMELEEWTWHIGNMQQDKLRAECERVISRFESQGVRALKALEGIVCVDS